MGERVGIKNGFAVPMLVEKRDPRIPDFDEVKDKVTKAVKDEKAKGQLEDKAKEIIANAKTPGDLKAAAAKLGFEAKAEANYKLATPLGEAGSSTLIDEARRRRSALRRRWQRRACITSPCAPAQVDPDTSSPVSARRL